ncbi:hypothetical protein GCM10025880_52580 [Methylorubrum aminovorans]|uniref:hypothetical protein n=1 Tax=Methylorubrum aminovorans TaxID=269069 RepID=UPI0023E945E9|nr:hypothetical protein [Methylorubrum aminovorans]GMA78841.1 hypothetical protein GCM10025880_52580 [Methylorubrum aminovorans]
MIRPGGAHRGVSFERGQDVAAPSAALKPIRAILSIRPGNDPPVREGELRLTDLRQKRVIALGAGKP